MWWMWGLRSSAPAPAPTPADNAPSLWDGGIRWGDPAAPFGDGTDGYWGAVLPASGRSGFPRLSVAIGGYLVLNELKLADWRLGRDDWLSALTPASATFDFVDVPLAAKNDTIVVGLMSDSTEHHSDALWVGRVDSISTHRDVNGFVTATIAATDIIGILGQAGAPPSIVAGYTLATLVEELAANAGLPLNVDTDPLVTLPVMTAASEIDGKVLDLINRAERSANALLFLKGSGRLHAAMRDKTNASAVAVIDLDGDSSPSEWDETTGPLVTRWELAGTGWGPIETVATTFDEYGDHTHSATDLLIDDPAPYAALIASDVLAQPRPIVTNASFPIRDMSQPMLFADPLDRVSMDGETKQLMSVQHRVTPIRDENGKVRTEWRTSISADSTQEALAGAPDPGPVTPPAVNTVTLTYTATKTATVYREANGDTGSESNNVLLFCGRFDGETWRPYFEWPIVWPANTIRVVSAKVALPVDFAASGARVWIQRVIESWTEGGLSWGGPKTTTDGRRSVAVSGTMLTASITAIAEAWRAGENNGLHVRSANEADQNRRATFWSDDADPELRPTLTLVLEVVS
jgi:hypothetical protein